jgi:hypothetical protein
LTVSGRCEADLGEKAAGRRVAEPELAAVAADELTGDREPQAGAAAVTVASFVEPGEAVEDPLPVRLGNPGSVVGDRTKPPEPLPRGELHYLMTTSSPRDAAEAGPG